MPQFQTINFVCLSHEYKIKINYSWSQFINLVEIIYKFNMHYVAPIFKDLASNKGDTTEDDISSIMEQMSQILSSSGISHEGIKLVLLEITFFF